MLQQVEGYRLWSSWSSWHRGMSVLSKSFLRILQLSNWREVPPSSLVVTGGMSPWAKFFFTFVSWNFDSKVLETHRNSGFSMIQKTGSETVDWKPESFASGWRYYFSSHPRVLVTHFLNFINLKCTTVINSFLRNDVYRADAQINTRSCLHLKNPLEMLQVWSRYQAHCQEWRRWQTVPQRLA